MTMSNLAAAGSLLTRALPLLLLTFLVFFNSPVWLMAATISRPRLWLALLFLTAIAAAFVVTVTADRVEPIMEAGDATDDQSVRLAGTPFETMPDPASVRALSRTERLNVMFVVAASQLSQIFIIAAMVGLLFLILGLILLSPELLAAWTRNGRSDGTFLGMTIPVPDSLIQISLFLGALTFMYISSRTVSDADYRTRFFDPLDRRPAAHIDEPATVTAQRYRRAPHRRDANNVVRVCVSAAGSGLLARNAFRTLSIWPSRTVQEVSSMRLQRRLGVVPGGFEVLDPGRRGRLVAGLHLGQRVLR